MLCVLVAGAMLGLSVCACSTAPAGEASVGPPATRSDPPSQPSASVSAAASASASAAGSPAPVFIVNDDLVCGEVNCPNGVTHCCAQAECGQLIPFAENTQGESYFLSPGECLATEQAGAIDPACPDSPNFCDDRGCSQVFAGCRRLSGDCGYWLEGTEHIVGGEEALSLGFGFGCVAVDVVR